MKSESHGLKFHEISFHSEISPPGVVLEVHVALTGTRGARRGRPTQYHRHRGCEGVTSRFVVPANSCVSRRRAGNVAANCEGQRRRQRRAQRRRGWRRRERRWHETSSIADLHVCKRAASQQHSAHRRMVARRLDGGCSSGDSEWRTHSRRVRRQRVVLVAHAPVGGDENVRASQEAD